MSSLYRRKVFPVHGAKGVIFFTCPFGYKMTPLLWAIRLLKREGFTVVGYDFNNGVFMRGDASLLPRLVEQVVEDIGTTISSYKAEGVDDFGFFGTSLGSFICYNAAARHADLKWGVFNTAGSAAKSIWKFARARKRFQSNGLELKDLLYAWKEVQYPPFAKVPGRKFVVVGSSRDTTIPIQEHDIYLKDVRESGAAISVVDLGTKGHAKTALTALKRCRSLVGLARPG